MVGAWGVGLGCAAAAAAPVVIEALDAVVREGVVVSVAPDGRAVAALDLATATERWRVSLAGPADAAVIHDLGRGRVLVQAAGRYTTIDTSTGERIAVREAPASWTFVHRGMGGCALRGECSLSPVSCDDGRPLGAALLGDRRWIHTPRQDDGPSPRCMGDLDVLAATDASVLVSSRTSQAPIVTAIDEGGSVLWRSSDPACASCAPLGAGAAPDGALCWTTDRRSATEAIVRGFDCATGAVRFAHPIALGDRDRSSEIVTGWSGSGPRPALLVQAGRRAIALSVDGERLWHRPLPAGTLANLPALRVPSYPLAIDGVDAIAHLDPATGETLRTREVASGREVRIASDGTIAVVREGSTFDRGGARVPPPEIFAFARAPTGSRATIGDREVLALPGDGWVLGEHREGERAWLVVAEARQGRPDRVHVLQHPQP